MICVKIRIAILELFHPLTSFLTNGITRSIALSENAIAVRVILTFRRQRLRLFDLAGLTSSDLIFLLSSVRCWQWNALQPNWWKGSCWSVVGYTNKQVCLDHWRWYCQPPTSQAVVFRPCLPAQCIVENHTTGNDGPRELWRDNIKEWTGRPLSSLLHIILRIAENRTRWATIATEAWSSLVG